MPTWRTFLLSSLKEWLWLSVRWRKSFLSLEGHSPRSLTRDRSFFRPCGMNTPHTHPRATEFLFVANEGQLEVGFIQENGAPYITNTLTQGQGTIFPMGSIHFQANLGCKPLTFVAALNSEDPGVNQIAQRCKRLDTTCETPGVDARLHFGRLRTPT